MKTTTLVSLLGGAFIAASIAHAWQKPESPNFIGKAFFSAVNLKDGSKKNMTSYGEFLSNRYVTDMRDVLQDRYKHYYNFDFPNAPREERYAALLRGPQKPVEPFVEEALIANATVTDCSGPTPASQAELKDCALKLINVGILSFSVNSSASQELKTASIIAETARLQAEAELNTQKALNSPYIPQLSSGRPIASEPK
jgi:hypothetical protein